MIVKFEGIGVWKKDYDREDGWWMVISRRSMVETQP